MIFDFLGVLILVLLVLLIGFLASRAWRARNIIVRLLLGILSTLLALLFALVLVVALIGFYKLNVAQAAPPSSVKVQASPEQVTRGQQIANICSGCHSTANKLPLDGAPANFIEGGLPAGVIQPPNLTPTGPLKDWTDGEIMRAIRDGVDKNGRPLLIMPSDQFHNMSDGDVQALVAFLRSQPPVAHDTPPTNLNTIGALLIGAGLFPTSAQPPTTQPVNAPPRAATAEYGKYLVDMIGCRACHGPDLGGGTANQFGPPAGPNLTAIVPKWSDADFIKTIRTGTDPSGHKLADAMPYAAISAATTDDDLKGIYLYLKSVPLVNRPSPTMAP